MLLNPAPARPLPAALLAHVEILTPNQHEAAQLAGVDVAGAGGLERAASVLHAHGVANVLVTLGSRGVFVSTPAGAALLPAFEVAATDTTAAGDVFAGALAAALVRAQPLPDAIRFASAAAAIAVTRPGAQASAPRRDEIARFLKDHGTRTVEWASAGTPAEDDRS